MDATAIVAATLFLQAASEELDLDGWSRPRTALVVDYRTACDAGVQLACAAVEQPLTLATVLPAAEEACANQDATACVVVGWAARADSERSTHLEQACTSGLPRACSEWVRATARPGDDEGVREAHQTRAHTACEAGDGLACQLEALLEFHRPGGDLAVVSDRAQLACDRGRADACAIPPRLAGARPEGSPDPAVVAACDVGVVAACLDLPELPYEPANVLEWCRAGAVDACRRVRPDLPWIGLLLAGGPDWALTAQDQGETAALAPYAAACGQQDLLACTVQGDVSIRNGHHEEGLALLAQTCQSGELAACRRVVGSMEVGYGSKSSPAEAARIRALVAEDDARIAAGMPYRTATSFAVPHPWGWRRSPEPITPTRAVPPAIPRNLPHGSWACTTRVLVTPDGKPGAVYLRECEPFLYATTYKGIQKMRFNTTENGGWYDMRTVFTVK